MLPHVVIHNAVSVDGRIDHLQFDIAKYYEIAGTFGADCALTGSETILRSMETYGIPPDSEAPQSLPQFDPDDERSLLVVVDSKGQIRTWQYLRTIGHWRDVMALCTRSTPEAYLDYLKKMHVRYLIVGDDRVDLRAALDQLNSCYSIKIVRVDSGGTLNGVMLRQGLVDEVSVMVHPGLVGGTSPASLFRAPDLTAEEGVIPLKLKSSRKLKGGVIWLRYSVEK